MNLPARPLLVLSFEGLATSAISSYGSSWNRTAALDAIAGTGCVWDRWTTSSDSPDALLRNLFAAGDAGPMQPWRSRGSVELITDNAAIADIAGGFDAATCVPAGPPQGDETPAVELEQTQFGKLIAAAIDRDLQQEPWSLMWLHSQFLTQRWDAPRDLFPIDELESDWDGPTEDIDLIETETRETLESLPPIFDTVIPPHLRLGDTPHPDLVTCWMRTYGCQVRLVDLMVEVLLQSLQAEDPQVLILGTSGFSLGQNGWIGHRCGPLRSAEIRLPMMLSDLGPIRIPQLTADRALAGMLRDLAGGNCDWCGPEAWGRGPTEGHVRTESSRAQSAVTTGNWFYVRDQDASEHLYLKPDDGDDFNDVARLRPEVLDQLSEQK